MQRRQAAQSRLADRRRPRARRSTSAGATQLGHPGDVETTATQRRRPLDQPKMPSGEHHGISDGYDEIVTVTGIEGTYLGIALLDRQP
jgi:hypothetical protein